MTKQRPIWQRARDFALYRLRPLRGWLKHSLRNRIAEVERSSGPLKLHIGCGTETLDGWVNLDIQKLPEVDVAIDIRAGLPFNNAQFVFAEHFLEHLDIDAALDFLLDVHRSLGEGGWLRLSTPNLDWVWGTVYGGERADHNQHLAAVINTNRAFYGWRHRFIWDRVFLEHALAACGYNEIRPCRYQESSISELSGLERHAKSPDTDEIPHVLVFEARKGPAQPHAFASLKRRVADDFLSHRDVL